ncbi:MAG: hypothetical protein FD123_4277 [Bacteroidetes bacterium]|nr:MAG: hypothetical protein FD123_4277 [Bacteroidota bacterium]
MKFTGIILLRLILSSATGLSMYWTSVNLQAWQHCSFGKTGSFSTYTAEAICRGSIIACYKAKGPMWRQDILIERMQICIPWRHVFYSPKYYTEEFYINPLTTPTNTEFITAGRDTLLAIGIKPFRKLPERITVHVYCSRDTITYYLSEKFPENITHVAPVPFSEKIDSGPYSNRN